MTGYFVNSFIEESTGGPAFELAGANDTLLVTSAGSLVALGGGDGIDAHAPAGRRRMNEARAVECNADMQFLAREVHENQIARLEILARYGRAEPPLLVRRARQMNTRAGSGVEHQAAAIEASGGRAAPPIRLTEHPQGIGDHHAAQFRCGGKGCAMGGIDLSGRRGGARGGYSRRAGTCGQQQGGRGQQRGV